MYIFDYETGNMIRQATAREYRLYQALGGLETDTGAVDGREIAPDLTTTVYMGL